MAVATEARGEKPKKSAENSAPTLVDPWTNLRNPHRDHRRKAIRHMNFSKTLLLDSLGSQSLADTIAPLPGRDRKTDGDRSWYVGQKEYK